MKLEDCTKAELLELLKALASTTQNRYGTAVENTYSIERYLLLVSGQRYDKCWDELIKTSEEISKLLPKYMDKKCSRKTVLQMKELVDKRDRLQRRLEKLKRD